MYLAPQSQHISALSTSSARASERSNMISYNQPKSAVSHIYEFISWNVTCVSFSSQRANDSTILLHPNEVMEKQSQQDNETEKNLQQQHTEQYYEEMIRIPN